MDSLIPFSRDQLISKTILGGVYYCLPPVGDNEMDLLDLFSGDDVLDDLPERYEQAKKEVDKSLEGKEKPLAEEYEKMISKRISNKLQKKETDLKANILKINNAIDKICVDFDHSKTAVECLKNIKYPESKKPSQFLPLGIKRTIYDWYSDQFVITVDESKN